MTTYLAIESAKALISGEVACQLLWYVTLGLFSNKLDVTHRHQNCFSKQEQSNVAEDRVLVPTRFIPATWHFG